MMLVKTGRLLRAPLIAEEVGASLLSAAVSLQASTDNGLNRACRVNFSVVRDRANCQRPHMWLPRVGEPDANLDPPDTEPGGREDGSG